MISFETIFDSMDPATFAVLVAISGFFWTAILTVLSAELLHRWRKRRIAKATIKRLEELP
jgi:hypothetical protein